jgi:TonB family protein
MPSFPSAQVAAPPGFAAPAGFATPPGYGAQGAAQVASEAEEPGSQAVEVQALFKGVVTKTRHLTDPSGKSQSNQPKLMILAGLALQAVALGTFIATVVSVGAEKHRYEQHLAADKAQKDFLWQPRTAAPDVVVFGGALAGIALLYMGLKRWGRTDGSFVIGSGTDADAPAPTDLIGGERHVLVNSSGADFVLAVTPQMQGEVVVQGQTMPLGQYVQQRGTTFPIADGTRVRIDAGQSQFYVTATAKPRVLPVPFLMWSWAEQKFTAASAVAILLFLLMIFAVPPDPKSLSLDLLNSDNRFVNFLIKPPEEKEEEMPEWLKKGNQDQGGKGKRHKGDEGKMGKKTSKNKQGLYGLKGPTDNPDPHLAKKLAEEEAKNAGILGLIKADEGSHLASIFGRDTALGNDAENVLGGLLGNTIGEAYGVGGLGLVGTGSGGGGTGEGTIGLGNLGTIGKGGGGGSGSGYGRGAGGLRGRTARAPDVIPGQAEVRGSLDKEIIRRIIRKHMNEVKYCYEQELVKKQDLQGRIAVQFTIAATGQVVTSVLQTSSMANRRVENCVVQAVRRWEFPKPKGGGIVIVTYPFVFNPAGGG